jgi:hypothetical protein
MSNILHTLKAIQSINNTAIPPIDFTGEFQDDKFVLLSWNTEKLGPAPIQEEIDTALAAVTEDIRLTGYKELRKREYPPIADYLDGVVKGDQAQTQAYIDACLAVKAKYPKP